MLQNQPIHHHRFEQTLYPHLLYLLSKDKHFQSQQVKYNVSYHIYETLYDSYITKYDL